MMLSLFYHKFPFFQAIPEARLPIFKRIESLAVSRKTCLKNMQYGLAYIRSTWKIYQQIL